MSKILVNYALLFVAVITIFLPHRIYAQEKARTPSAQPTLRPEVVEDNRVKVLRGFLASYDSPLTGSAETFVRTADKYELDWRFVAAISGVESTFGKQIPYESYNAWGWGIYGDNMIRFTSWDEAIETISKSLREKYIDTWGAQDTYQIGRFYAASPTWAQRVEYFMQKITDYELKNPSKTLSLSL